MSKQARIEKKKRTLDTNKIIDDLSKRHTFNRGNLLLLIAIIWVLGLFLIVAKYGKIW
jgi:hypothetical protein